MAVVTGLTAERMQEIIDATVVGAHISTDNLILELYDGSEIDAGNVRGPQGDMGPNADVGDVKTSIRSTIPGWLPFGATYAGAESLYPDLWAHVVAECPASWRSGSDLVLPSMDGAGTRGGGVVGEINGNNTVTLASANLPPHQHTTPAHTHPMPHTHTMAHTHEHAHTHTMAHTHSDTFAAATTVTTSVRESSTPGTLDSLMTASATGVSELQTNNPTAVTSISGAVGAASTSNTGGASDATTGGSSAANTGGSSAGNTSLSDPGVTGNGPGTSTPVNIEPKALRLNYFIKT